jgi:hypothetical protein
MCNWYVFRKPFFCNNVIKAHISDRRNRAVVRKFDVSAKLEAAASKTSSSAHLYSTLHFVMDVWFRSTFIFCCIYNHVTCIMYLL